MIYAVFLIRIEREEASVLIPLKNRVLSAAMELARDEAWDCGMVLEAHGTVTL